MLFESSHIFIFIKFRLKNFEKKNLKEFNGIENTFTAPLTSFLNGSDSLEYNHLRSGLDYLMQGLYEPVSTSGLGCLKNIKKSAIITNIYILKRNAFYAD